MYKINDKERRVINLLKTNIVMNVNEIKGSLPEIENITLVLNRMKKKGYIINISKGYYIGTDREMKDYYKIIEKIFMEDNTGVYTGIFLLNKYGYMNQVPHLKYLKSTSNAKVLLNTVYKVQRLDNRLKDVPKWMLEMFEVVKQLKAYDIEIDYVDVTLKVMNNYDLKLKDLNQIEIINYEYYYESLKVYNRKEKIVKEIKNLKKKK